MIPVVTSSSAAQQASVQSGGGPEMAEKVLNSEGVHLLKIPYSVEDGQLMYLEYEKVDTKKLNAYTLLSVLLSALVLCYLMEDKAGVGMLSFLVLLIALAVRGEILQSMARNSVACIPIPEAIKRFLPENAQVISMNFDWYHKVVRVYYITKRQSPSAPEQASSPQGS